MPLAISSRLLTALTGCVVLAGAAASAPAVAAERNGGRATNSAEYKRALDACARIYMSAKQLTARPLVIRSKEQSPPLVQFGQDYVIELKAVATRDRKWVGGARCVVQTDGTVLSLDGKPLRAGGAETRLVDR